MNQVYFHYQKWEDYQNGMYATDSKYKELDIGRAQRLLSNSGDFAIACSAVVKKWPISTAQNLTNTECNRNAWLGQAACCFVHKVPEVLTRIAWGRLSNAQRLEANKIASFTISKWENENKKKNQLELFSL